METVKNFYIHDNGRRPFCATLQNTKDPEEAYNHFVSHFANDNVGISITLGKFDKAQTTFQN